MNKVYFVRHAKPDFSVHDDLTRPLTEEGIKSSKELVEFFKDKNITKMYSSPYKRSIDTINEVAKDFNLKIEMVDDFRERKISDCWIENFNEFSKNQWKDFDYKMDGGESLKEAQDRNIVQLHRILKENANENIVIGTHGTALSTIINFYDKDFGYEAFDRIKGVMPWIVCAEFDGVDILNMKELINIEAGAI